MKQDLFFEQFELLADAPNGVQKLRELILQLAVQGKLVPQDENDEPAAVLLERIQADKQRLEKQGKIKKSKQLPPISPDEVPFELPKSWEWVRLSEIADLKIGKTPARKETKYWDSEDYPWISISDMKHLNILESSKESVSQSAYDKVFKGNLSLKGTLIMSFKLTIGKMSILGMDAFHNEAIVSIIPYIESLKTYLFKCLSGFNISREKSNAIKGNTLNKSSLERIILAIPPLAEQKRIVAKVDELMGLCDELETRQERRQRRVLQLGEVATTKLIAPGSREAFRQDSEQIFKHFDLIYSTPENVGQLRQAILQLAVMGKLVPQDATDEPASVLLEKIKAEKARLVKEKKIKKSKKLPAIKPDEVPFDLPQSWEWVKLGQLAESLRYGTSKKCDYQAEGIPVLRIPNLVNGKIDQEDLKFTSLSPKEFDGLKLQPNDILMIRSNGSTSLVGRTAVISSKEAGYAYAGYLVRVRLFQSFLFADYLYLALETNSVREQIEVPIRTTSGVKNINSTEISNLLIPLPPLPEQKRIVTKVNQLMTLCDDLESQLSQTINDREKLLETAVHQLLAA